MRQIICKNGEIALCDDEDYPLLSRFIWYMGSEVKNGGGYPCCFFYGKNNTRKQVFMHQLVMAGATNIDHSDLNKLNNQKSNLRNATRAENEWNKPKQRTSRGKPCTSKYKGVCLINGRWLAQIKRNGVHYNLGFFSNEEDAARAYNERAKELSGDFVWLNPIEINHQAPSDRWGV